MQKPNHARLELNRGVSKDRPPRFKNSKGFTLIEVLVAMAIYMVVISIVAVALSNMLNTTNTALQNIIKFNALQRAVIDLQRDFIQTIDRPILDENNHEQAAFVSPNIDNGDTLNFSTKVNIDPFSERHQSDIRRIGYRYRDGKLYRIMWPVLDRVNGQSSEKKILDQITDLSWQYVGEDNALYDFWPPSPNRSHELPVAVKLDLTFNKGERLSKIFLIKG